MKSCVQVLIGGGFKGVITPTPKPQPRPQQNWQLNKKVLYQQPESPFVVGQSVMYEGTRYSVTVPKHTQPN
ncbi:hypothetical protein NDI33_26385 [Trichocoleus sp. DQ-A1]